MIPEGKARIMKRPSLLIQQNHLCWSYSCIWRHKTWWISMKTLLHCIKTVDTINTTEMMSSPQDQSELRERGCWTRLTCSIYLIWLFILQITEALLRFCMHKHSRYSKKNSSAKFYENTFFECLGIPLGLFLMRRFEMLINRFCGVGQSNPACTLTSLWCLFAQTF